MAATSSIDGDLPTRKRDFLKSIEKNVQVFWQQHKFGEVDAPSPGLSQPKFMTTFPYPYLNGQLHLGHTFTLSKCEFAARYQRLQGKRVLFPFAFHSTGMPISACCDKLKQELSENVPVLLASLKAKQPDFIEESQAALLRIEHALSQTKMLSKSSPKITSQLTTLSEFLATSQRYFQKISSPATTGGIIQRYVQAIATFADEADAILRSALEFSENVAPASSATVMTRGGRSKEKAKQTDAVYQWEILQMMGIPDEDIPKFTEAIEWVRHFPSLAVDDLKQLGAMIDWRRTFTTTELAPFYDSFIKWQFNTLYKQGDKLAFGTRYTIWSPQDNQPCMDHDRASGEGVKPVEYTGIKLRCLGPFPQDSKLAGLDAMNTAIYLVAATMRPETMVGQTNCWIHPDGEYGIFRTGNPNEVFILTERAAYNLSFQSCASKGLVFAPKFGHVEKIDTLYGRDLIGIAVSAPCSVHPQVWVLPMLSIKMDVGTGIVTSVPSDSPADYAALQDLRRKEDLRARHGVQLEWLLDPVPIIHIPHLNTKMIAPETVERMNINSQNDPRLEEAKDICYRNGFGKGVMIAGIFSGQPVQAIKDTAKQMMIDAGQAIPYAEPASPVISRSGDTCVVCLTDQWYFRYGDEAWREQAREAILAMNTYGEENRLGLERALDFIQGWPCSRTYGMGSRIPWDSQYLIESLSDSTIYNAFYTVAGKLHGKDNMFGTLPGPLAILPEQMTDAVWDYIFLEGPFPQDQTNVPSQLILDELKREFSYWFPTDMRASGKDLQGNHLIFYVYNNVAIFPREFWPAGIRCNGFVLLDGEKMSKSKGNFLSLNEALQLFGADALRWGLAAAGDGLEDANVETKFANKSILRLYALIEWFNEMCSQSKDMRCGELTLRDLIFEAQIDQLISDGAIAYEQTMFRKISTLMFNVLAARDNYRLSTAAIGMHRQTIFRFMTSFAIILSPICPHSAEHLWQIVHGRDPGSLLSFDATDSIISQVWPTVAGIDPIFLKIEEYILTQRAECIRLHGVACNTARRTQKPLPKHCQVLVSSPTPEWQREVATRLTSFLPTIQGRNADFNEFWSFIQTNPLVELPGVQLEQMKNFAEELLTNYTRRGEEAFLSIILPFDEFDVLTKNTDFLRPPKELDSLEVVHADATDSQKAKNAKPGKPAYHFF